MSESLEKQFSEAVRLATANLGDLAEGIDRGYRTIHAYLSGERRVTPEAACNLAAFLRERSRAFEETADALEAAAEKERRLYGD